MDNSLIKADIFFFVSTIALAILSLLLMIGMLYVLSILRTIKQISRTAKTGAETVVEGIQEAKTEFQRDGFVPETLFSIFKKLYQKKPKSKK